MRNLDFLGCHIIADTVEQGCGQVAFARIRQHTKYVRTRFRFLGNCKGAGKRRASRNADKDAFIPRQ